MDKFIINGGKPLRGTVRISGAKNAALPIMAATLLAPGTHRLHNVPALRDINTMAQMLEHLGCKVSCNGSLEICANHLNFDEAPYDLVKTMRASVLVMGPLVARLRHARISLPGGCAIGARPINLHLKAMEALGADIHLKKGYAEVIASRLKGAEIHFDIVTVTGTANAMMAAAVADGITTITNAAREPEIIDLALFLTSMGADIEGAGSDRIVIRGVPQLKPAEHTVVADRIEAGTFMMAAAITGGDVILENAPTEFLQTAMAKLEEAGVEFEDTADGLRVTRPESIKSVDVTTAPHPGFATDLQAQFTALMAIAEGTSVITETIFENRFMHIPELARMGADISVDDGIAVVKGMGKLTGAPVMATDLRASASLVLAGLAAEGTTEIDRIYHIDRGYERIEERLRTLGAEIERVSND
jgi:UDP-N-acetylglucosamine 1-carboxyvinyltransferase